MSSREKDEKINKFINIVQCSRAVAIECLENTEWNEQVALNYFLEFGESQSYGLPNLTTDQPFTTGINIDTYENVPSDRKWDDITLENALRGPLSESYYSQPLEKPSDVVSPRLNSHKSIISSKVYTFDGNDKTSEDDDDDDDDQASYFNGLEPSRRQVFQPSADNDKNNALKNILEAAGKIGAFKVDKDESGVGVSSRMNGEDPSSDLGYSLGNTHLSLESQDHLSSPTTPDKIEKLPIRFYSNGFTVGDGDLRRFEENQDFINYIKRGEIPPELKRLNTEGKEIEINLEDHRGEEYKRVAPAFKAFSGTGHVVGLPESGQFSLNSSANSPMNAIDGPPDPNVLEKIAQNRLKTSSSSTSIRLRLPGIGVPVRIELDVNRTLMDVRSFLNENVPSLQSNKFEFLEPPSTKIKYDDEICKICDTKLSNSTLVVRLVI